MGFMLIINLLLCFRIIEKNRPWDYILFGVASGLLLGIKIVGGLFFVIPVLMIGGTFYIKKLEGQRKEIEFYCQIRWLIASLFLAFLVFVLFHPHIFLDLGKYLAFYMREKRDWLDRTEVSILQMLYIWGERSVVALGLPLAVFALIGTFIPEKGSLRFKGPIIIFLFLYYLFFRSAFNARYVISIAPLLCIFGAKLYWSLLSHENKSVKIIGVITISITLCYSFYITSSGIILRLTDSRPLAARYIDRTVEEGSSIGIGYVSEEYSWRHFPWWYPRIDYSKFKEVDFLNEPEVLIISSYAFSQIQETLVSGKLSNEYVLPEKHQREWYRYSAPSPSIFELYDQLLNKGNSNYVLEKSFMCKVNVPIEFPPPEIRIYRKMSI
jgi:hypothetical protein